MHGVICTVVLAALSLPLITTHAFPDGAPRAVCYAYHGSRVISPKHPAGNASDAPGGYFIASDLRDTNFFFDTSKQTYTSKRTRALFCINFKWLPYFYNPVTLYSTGQPFRGFVIQVCIVIPNGIECLPFTGEFVKIPLSARLLNCGDPSTGPARGGALVSNNVHVPKINST